MRISAILGSTSAETAMPNLNAGKARIPNAPQSYDGWALERSSLLDVGGSRGLVADITTSSGIKRQSTFAVLATVSVEGIPAFLQRLGGDHQDLASAIRSRQARDLLQAAFGDHVPGGYLRALARIGPEPLTNPDLYRRLFEIYADPTEARKAQVLRYCGPLNATKIAAVDSLDPMLLDPEIVSSLLGSSSIDQLNSLLGFIRTICSSATDEEIVATFRQKVGGWHRVAERWLSRADRFPPPPFNNVPGLTPITSAKEMTATGAAMKNCLGTGTKIGEVLLNFSYHFRGEIEIAPSVLTPVVVEVVPVSDGRWMLAGVHGPRHRSLPPEIVHKVVQPLLDRGALVCAAAQPDVQKIADALGIHRWDEFRLPVIQDRGEDDEVHDEEEAAEDAFA